MTESVIQKDDFIVQVPSEGTLMLSITYLVDRMESGKSQPPLASLNRFNNVIRFKDNYPALSVQCIDEP